jgi:transcriptional regulator with XRE-family HTH domain
MKRQGENPASPQPGCRQAYRQRDSRLALNMSQADLGKNLGVTFHQIQTYDSGRNRISRRRLYAGCKTLNVSPCSLFARELNAYPGLN